MLVAEFSTGGTGGAASTVELPSRLQELLRSLNFLGLDSEIRSTRMDFSSITAYGLSQPLTGVAGSCPGSASALFLLARNPQGRETLKYILEKKPELVNRFDAEILNSSVPDTERSGLYPSILHLLSGSDAGNAILIKLLGNSVIATGLFLKTLTENFPEKLGSGVKTSAFYRLAWLGKLGHSVLIKLIAANAGLIYHITRDTLCLRPNNCPSAFHSLAGYNESGIYTGHVILRELFKNNILMASITLDDLCAGLPYTVKDYTNTSSLYYLASSSTGRLLLKEIFKYRPDLKSGITAAHLCVLRPHEAGPYANISPLYCFAQKGSDGEVGATGFDLLAELLDNPGVAERITQEAVCIQRGDATSVLYYLTEGPKGLEILRELVEKNPLLLTGIGQRVSTAGEVDRAIFTRLDRVEPPIMPKAVLVALPEFETVHARSSLEYSLDFFYYVLNLLLNCPEFAEKMTVDVLCARRIETEGSLADSLLYFLIKQDSIKSREILNKLVRINPSILTAIIAEAVNRGDGALKKLRDAMPSLQVDGITLNVLCTPLPSAVGPYSNTSALQSLADSDSKEAYAILDKLFQDRELVPSITADAFYGRGHDGNPDSVFYLMTKNQRVHSKKPLITLFELNPDLFTAMTVDDLCKCPLQGFLANTSALYWLSSDLITGHKILNKLFLAKPALMREITGKILCLQRPAAAGGLANTSVLYLLTDNHSGRELLLKLLINRPGLAKEITAKALCAPSPVIGSPNVKINALYLLSINSAIGHEILGILVRENRSIRQRIAKEIFPEGTSGQQLLDKICRGLGPIPEEEGDDESDADVSESEVAPTAERRVRAGAGSDSGYRGGASLDDWPERIKTPGDCEAINSLWSANDLLIPEITAENLCKQHDGASLLSWLARGAEAGHKILVHLLNKNADLAAGIKSEDLDRRIDGLPRCSVRSLLNDSRAGTAALEIISFRQLARSLFAISGLVGGTAVVGTAVSEEVATEELRSVGVFSRRGRVYAGRGDESGDNAPA